MSTKFSSSLYHWVTRVSAYLSSSNSLIHEKINVSSVSSCLKFFYRFICWWAIKIILENQSWCFSILLIKNNNIKQPDNKNNYYLKQYICLKATSFHIRAPENVFYNPSFSPHSPVLLMWNPVSSTTIQDVQRS